MFRLVISVHLTSVILATTVFMVQFSKTGYGSPLFDSSNSHSWLDKLPSLEVKVKTDGITVRTGPSRQEIYSIVAYVLLGAACLLLMAILVAVCVYKCCLKRDPSQIIIHEGGGIGPPFTLHPTRHSNRYRIQSTPNAGFQGMSNIVGTHLWPSVTGRSAQHPDFKTSSSSSSNQQVPFRSRN